MFDTPQERLIFIQHLKYLFSLSRKYRYKRNDWKELRRILKEQGYRRPYNLSDEGRGKLKEIGASSPNKYVHQADKVPEENVLCPHTKLPTIPFN